MRFCGNPTNRPISTRATYPPHGSRIIRLIRARSQPVPAYKKNRRGMFPSGCASVPLRIDFDLMLAKEKTSVTLFFVRHPCAAAHRVLHSRFYFFYAQPLDFVSSSYVRRALSFLQMVNSSSAHPLISPSGASSNQALIIALIHSNFFPSKRCREKDAPRGILSRYLYTFAQSS